MREALKYDDFFEIKTVIHPLPQTEFEENIRKADPRSSAWLYAIAFSFPFITGSFAPFVIAERQSKAKHLLTVAGVRPTAYWLSAWLWDVANYQIPMWITVALMFIFDVEIITTSERGVFGGALILLILFGPAAASFTYCVSFMFSSPSICNVVVISFGGIVGLVGTLAFDPNFAGDIPPPWILAVLRFFPPFCLGSE